MAVSLFAGFLFYFFFQSSFLFVFSRSVSVCFKWDRAVTSMLAGCFDFLEQVLFI